MAMTFFQQKAFANQWLAIYKIHSQVCSAQSLMSVNTVHPNASNVLLVLCIQYSYLHLYLHIYVHKYVLYSLLLYHLIVPNRKGKARRMLRDVTMTMTMTRRLLPTKAVRVTAMKVQGRLKK